MFYNLCLVRNDAAGYVMYYGDKGTTIEYNPDLEEWHMRSAIHPNVSANTTVPFSTLSLGVHTWMVTPDKKCHNGTEQLTLSLSSCNMRVTQPDYTTYKEYYEVKVREEFICHDGLCVDLEKRCDGFVDCQVIILLFTFINQTNIFY